MDWIWLFPVGTVAVVVVWLALIVIESRRKDG